MSAPQRREWTRWATIAVVVLAAVIVLSALASSCGIQKATEPFRDAPRGGTNGDAADVIELPDGFNNLATKCDHGNRVYVTYHGDSAYGAVAVVANDPTCPGSRR